MSTENSKFQLSNWEIVSVNPADKKWDWSDLFCFWGVATQSIISFSLIASLYLVYSLNFLVVLIGTLTGSIFVFWFTNLIGKPSQKHGIPFPVFLRISMGLNGARYVSLLRGLVGVFMFGIQTYFLSKSISYLIRIAIYSIDNSFLDKDLFAIFFFGLNIIDWLSFISAMLIQIFLFSRGHSFNKFLIKFSALFVYFGIILFLIIIMSQYYKDVVSTFTDILVYESIINLEGFIKVISVAGVIFTYFSLIILNFGDFSRYVKNESQLKRGNLSIILNLLIFSISSTLIVIGADIILNKNLVQMDQIFTNPTDIIGKFDNLILSIIALIFILFASASSNLIANYIPTQNFLLNFFPNKLNLNKTAILIGLIASAIGLLWSPLLSQIGILSFIDTIGSFFGPIFGIIIIDYYIIKDQKIVNKDIFKSSSNTAYFYSNGWHIKAVYSLFIGFIFSSATIWNVNFMFLESFSWIIGALVSSITYYLLADK